jgi:AcrR family transcriptional regulator
MSELVKPRRRYDTRRRKEQAALTRRDIVVAAGSLFRTHGYAGTTMPSIASKAGVVVETIYRAFGSKSALFTAVVEAAVAGGAGRANVAVEQRPAIRAVIEELDPARQIERYVATQPGIHARSGPLLRVLRDAVAVEPDLQGLWRQLEASRLAGQGRFAALLAERGSLRGGLTVEDARDIIWTLTSLSVYESLVIDRAWAPERYEAWLARALTHELLR